MADDRPPLNRAERRRRRFHPGQGEHVQDNLRRADEQEGRLGPQAGTAPAASEGAAEGEAAAEGEPTPEGEAAAEGEPQAGADRPAEASEAGTAGATGGTPDQA